MHRPPSSRFTVADIGRADRFAAALVRNIVAARRNTTIFATGLEAWPAVRAFLTDEAKLFGARIDSEQDSWDLCIVGDSGQPVVEGPVTSCIVMPDAKAEVNAARHIRLELGEPSGDVIVVPGTARDLNGRHTLTAETFGRLRRAERLAERRPPRAVILSGWNGFDGHSSSEAAQMLEAWRGREVPVILDEAARTTAENAVWAASLTTAMGDVATVRVVAAWVSAVRLGLATWSAFRRTSVRPRMSVVWGRAQAASWRPAVVGLLHLRRHMRIGRAFLSRGPGSRDAQL